MQGFIHYGMGRSQSPIVLCCSMDTKAKISASDLSHIINWFSYSKSEQKTTQLICIVYLNLVYSMFSMAS